MVGTLGEYRVLYIPPSPTKQYNELRNNIYCICAKYAGPKRIESMIHEVALEAELMSKIDSIHFDLALSCT